MILALPCLLLCWMPLVDSMAIRFNYTLAGAPIKLDMVVESVDDMYDGCDKKMLEMVKSKYYKKERSLREDAWKEAEECANKKAPYIRENGLTKEHLIAICAYTGNGMYSEFNAAVRTGRRTYVSSFQFHSLHFLLTSAIQTLNRKNCCHDTYRRTGLKFTGAVGDQIRFGFFASSSYRADLTEFGSETCFKITTCRGAYLRDYSVLDFSEEEVLIPPYEKFTITKVIKKKGGLPALRDCQVVYVVESSGVVSNLNCKLVPKAP